MNYYERLTEEHFMSLLRELYGPSGMLRDRPYKLYNKEIKENNNEMKQGLKVEITNKNASYGDSRSYVYYIDDNASFMANQMPYPNCCGIAILKDMSVYSRVDKADGIKIINAICEDLYKNDKYSKILFYTNVGSESAKLFETYPDITILDPFKNRRSGNVLIGFEINLLKEDDLEKKRYVSLWDEPEDDDDDEDSEEEEDEIDHTIRQIAESQRMLRAGATRGVAFISEAEDQTLGFNESTNTR